MKPPGHNKAITLANEKNNETITLANEENNQTTTLTNEVKTIERTHHVTALIKPAKTERMPHCDRIKGPFF